MIWKSITHKRIAQGADIFTTLLGVYIAYLLLYYLNNIFPGIIAKPYNIENHHVVQAVLLSFIYIYLFEKYGAYSYLRFTSLRKEYVIVIKTNTFGIFAAILLSFIIKETSIPRTFFILLYLVLIILFILEKTFLYYGAKIIRKNKNNRHSVIIVGTGVRAKKLIETIKLNYEWGLDVIGILSGDPENIGKEFHGVKVIDSYNNLINVFKELNPSEVIITLSSNKFGDIRQILEVCEKEGVHVKLNSDIFGKITKRVNVDKVYGINFVSIYMTTNNEFSLIMKRIMDIFIAIIAIILYSPLMLIACIGILISDGFPIFYKWNVVGYNKKAFSSWKFRTMVKNADDLKNSLQDQNEMNGPVFKIKNDPRVIPFGRWLRKWSIDETPQLFSVIKGDMSIVGPRPAGPHELIGYESWHRRKLSIKPGLTCLWQVNGRNHISNFDDWVKLDLEYIDNWSLALDFEILFKTVYVVIRGKGAS